MASTPNLLRPSGQQRRQMGENQQREEQQVENLKKLPCQVGRFSSNFHKLLNSFLLVVRLRLHISSSLAPQQLSNSIHTARRIMPLPETRPRTVNTSSRNATPGAPLAPLALPQLLARCNQSPARVRSNLYTSSSLPFLAVPPQSNGDDDDRTFRLTNRQTDRQTDAAAEKLNSHSTSIEQRLQDLVPSPSPSAPSSSSLSWCSALRHQRRQQPGCSTNPAPRKRLLLLLLLLPGRRRPPSSLGCPCL